MASPAGFPEEELLALHRMLEENPERAFRKSSKLALEALKAGRKDLAARLEAIRAQAFGRLHRRIHYLEGVPQTLTLTLLGYVLAYLGGRLNTHAEAAYSLPALAAGAALAILFSHPLGHLAAARTGGIKIHGVYLSGKIRLEPTILVKLETYYQAKPDKRFWFHMAGPIATFTSTAAMAALVWATGYPQPVKIVVAAIPVIVVLTEVFNSRVHGDVARALKARRGSTG